MMADWQGLLADPQFNQGIGLLAGVLSHPTSAQEAIAPGITLGNQAMVGREALLKNQAIRERILAAQRTRQAQDRLHGLLAGNEPVNQNQVLGLLADISPDTFAKGLLSAIVPQNPTGFQRDFEYLTKVLGLTTEQALDRLRKGTVVNVGQNKTLTPSDARMFTDANGNPAPPGLPIKDVLAQGYRLRSRTPTAQEDKQATDTAVGLDILDRLDRVVTKNKIRPGFIDEGGIAQFLATPAGQVVSTGVKLLGGKLEVNGPQAQALSLQEQLSNQLLAAMRGASVGPEEQKKFEQQLPRLTQTPTVFAANIRNTRRNLQMLSNRMAAQRTGRAPAMAKPSAKPKMPKVIDFNDLPG